MTTAEYNSIVTQWANSAFRFAFKTVNDAEEAKDIVQQGFEVLWTKHKDLEVEKAKSFLFTVIHRKGMDYFRNKKMQYADELEAQHIKAYENNSSEWQQYLHEALSILDVQGRQLVLLKDYEGYNYQEIGKITGLSDSQVKVYLHRARKALKNHLLEKKLLL
jgi:RNA polymerase sigma factor (sigma-70 family)